MKYIQVSASLSERCQQAKTFEVLPTFWPALQVFLACQTQWRMIASMQGSFWQGLDYNAVAQVMRWHGIEACKESELFAQLQLIESGALEVLNAKQ